MASRKIFLLIFHFFLKFLVLVDDKNAQNVSVSFLFFQLELFLYSLLLRIDLFCEYFFFYLSLQPPICVYTYACVFFLYFANSLSVLAIYLWNWVMWQAVKIEMKNSNHICEKSSLEHFFGCMSKFDMHFVFSLI